jgi:hypothetical protein
LFQQLDQKLLSLPADLRPILSIDHWRRAK